MADVDEVRSSNRTAEVGRLFHCKIAKERCCRTACLILVTLPWSRYTTVPNDITLHRKSSRTFENDTVNPIFGGRLPIIFV